MIYIILLILGLIAFFSEISLIFAWIISYIKFKNIEISEYTPKVNIIVPCKGVDGTFDENILSICNQDYIDYKVIFVTDSKKDPAYKKLERLVGKRGNVKIVISELLEQCSGKISALITGIAHVDDTEVYVFADSDIKPHEKWLTYLISHLNEENIGASTGYRWYFPSDFRSLLLSAWNMIESVSLFFQMSNYSWGGSTAIKKKLFDKLDIIEKWKNGFSDDLILTDTIKKSKYNIKFVPNCIVESPPEGDLAFIIRWGTRQLTWVRWYNPLWWYVSVIGSIGLKIITILGFIIISLGWFIPGLLMVSTIFLEMSVGGVAHLVSKHLMYYPENRYKSSILYALLMPAIFFIIAYNNLASIFINEIKWGGRTYKKRDVIK